MDKFIIEHSRELSGNIYVSGAKNAILPAMAACLLAPGKSILRNVPNLIDLKTLAHLLRVIGARVEYENGSMSIDSKDVCFPEAPYELVSKMRASIYVLGPLVARLGKARVSFPGGCAIGTRPVDLHLKALEALGATIEIEHGYINAKAEKLVGTDIHFDKSSVGATINTLMAAVYASGTTRLFNAAMEPEVDSTIDLLNKMGAQISGKGTTTLEIHGVDDLFPVEMNMIPDRIEAGTFLIAGALSTKPVTVCGCQKEHLMPLLDKLREAGCSLAFSGQDITVTPPDQIKPVNILTLPHPGFPTDLQAQFTVLMCLADGVSYIEDTVFPDRFMHVAELNRLQANIKMDRNVASVKGVEKLSGAEVMATDLRASAALVLAGMVAEGSTTVSRIYHIDRGYDRIEEKLNSIGAKIQREIG
ncbi:MAG: UDP-N-acetylglucosamine 1-carboxyvinyltransferase [Candidatus Cloacimonetes bacterium]|jgi:UDP-N-acetylglucosamine 1-carboxyvinyltransferase|nr:UDP-N-acetylglucosamine 1-carboxyvinyltransferase [Candidatus Cloacimonadota bacterium]MDY0336763.1 UDP-N-acetylglucosamine 1-carboxyvinyltransferase [Candidatus Cloacimonadaceae bacterium]MCB5270065.1 UDP-N-acetylglucosamine 1-carboxyvinyltransferase [Candidatus Cloacimonadota bacterium]MCK9335512.1 UDP-N-acetylglucosamine 1-carboxyvinyltransferase [Candidatus Cloacimonadota bacterium]MDD2543495.1 UDP-N-acetylglucosamine 1-carboxyvinyltransferase [Candidatus Cloacimonadota bacterium]